MINEYLTFEAVEEKKVEGKVVFKTEMNSSLEVALFIWKVIQQEPPQCREIIIKKIHQVLPEMENREVMKVLLWILSEYCSSQEEIQRSLLLIKLSIGNLPLSQQRIPQEERQAQK